MSSLTLVRPACISFGLALVLMATVLYEDEEGVIQNKLEEWWVRLSYTETHAVRKHVAFITAVAALGSRLFDRLFGKKLFSPRSVLVSACFSLASLLLVCSPGLKTGLLFQLDDFPYYEVVFGLTVLALLPAIIGARRSTKLWRVLQVLWVLAVVYAGLLVLACMDIVDWFNLPYSGRSVWVESSYYLAFILLTIASDALFIVATRWLLRKSSNSDSRVKTLGLVFGNVLLAGVLVVLPVGFAWGLGGVLSVVRSRDHFLTILTYVGKSSPRQTFLSTLGASNVLDGLAATTFFILLFVLLLHRLLWPVVRRPVYALASRGVLRRRRFFLIVGMALVGLGGLSKSTIHVIEKILGGMAG